MPSKDKAELMQEMRQRRKKAGLIEVREWVLERDAARAKKYLAKLAKNSKPSDER